MARSFAADADWQAVETALTPEQREQRDRDRAHAQLPRADWYASNVAAEYWTLRALWNIAAGLMEQGESHTAAHLQAAARLGVDGHTILRRMREWRQSARAA